MTRRSRRYKIETPGGHTIDVRRMSEEDIKFKLAEFEAKYGMTSEEFSRRWNRGELDCGVRDFIAWVAYCHAASKTTSTV